MASGVAAALIGLSSVIDGDTLEIHGQRIRIFGIDAPEAHQVCTKAGEPWRCGQAAAMALDEYIAGRTVTCEPIDTDRYKRIVARCSVGGVELNAWLVEQGMALDYERYSGGDFADEEAEARVARRGIWASEFVQPAEWRKGKR